MVTMPARGVAVVIPVYNRPASVLESLDSVARQTVPPAHVIVVDDGSTDRTAASVSTWIRRARGAPPTELLRTPRRGAPAARNSGLARCRMPLVAFLDSDDLWPEDFLARAVGALNRGGDAVAATADRLFVTSCGTRSRIDPTDALTRDPTGWLFSRDGGIASATLLCAESVRSLRGFPEDQPTGHDIALFLRLSRLGRWLHLPGLPVTFRGGPRAAAGEHGRLAHDYDDRNARWARIFEDFIVLHGGSEALPRDVYARVLAQRWYRAGRDLLRQGEVARGRDCLRRATLWRFHLKAWWRLGASYLRRSA
jgi:glycosyltransferase involved in cell wall biosynthesis